MKYIIEIEKSGISLALDDVKSEEELEKFLYDFENNTTNAIDSNVNKTITSQGNLQYTVKYHIDGLYLSHPDEFLSLTYSSMRLMGWGEEFPPK